MLRRVPDVSKLERLTGFRPRTPLSQIIEDVIVDQQAQIAPREAGWRVPAAIR